MQGTSRGMLHHLGQLFSKGTLEESDRDYSQIHISEITGCARRLWLQLQKGRSGLQPVSMPMHIGTALHELTQAKIIATNPHIQAEVPVDFRPTYPVIGSADLVDDEYVIDLKFLSSWGYRIFGAMKGGNLAYKVQVLTYAYGLERAFASIFLVDRGTLSFKAQSFIVKHNLETIKYYLERAKIIYEADYLPDRDHETANNKECGWCPFKESCWNE